LRGSGRSRSQGEHREQENTLAYHCDLQEGPRTTAIDWRLCRPII
jgi:hypothetical protein